MLPSLNLPLSLLGVLGCLRPCFTAPTFTTFCGLVAGLAGQVRRRTVVGMLLGACLQRAWPHDRVHYFFSRARWQVDELGIAVARLVVEILAGPGAEVVIALDDSVFVRSGKKVHGAGWQHDGSARNLQKLSYGNCFVTAGIVVQLPFCSRAWCLPVLARLHLPGKGAGPSKVAVAAQLVALLAVAFGDRQLHVVADAAYHGPALRDLPVNVTWTCRLPRTAVLYDLAPPRTGRRGRPRTKGDRLGTPADLAATATWTTHHVVTYHGRTDVRHIAAVRCLWYGSFHARPVTVAQVAQNISEDARAQPGSAATDSAGSDLARRSAGDRLPGHWAVMRRAEGVWQAALVDMVGEVVGGCLGVDPERGWSSRVGCGRRPRRAVWTAELRPLMVRARSSSLLAPWMRASSPVRASCGWTPPVVVR